MCASTSCGPLGALLVNHVAAVTLSVLLRSTGAAFLRFLGGGGGATAVAVGLCFAAHFADLPPRLSLLLVLLLVLLALLLVLLTPLLFLVPPRRTMAPTTPRCCSSLSASKPASWSVLVTCTKPALVYVKRAGSLACVSTRQARCQHPHESGTPLAFCLKHRVPHTTCRARRVPLATALEQPRQAAARPPSGAASTQKNWPRAS